MGETKFTFYNHILSGNKLWTFTFGLLNFWKNGLVDLKSMDGSKVDCLFFFFLCGHQGPPSGENAVVDCLLPLRGQTNEYRNFCGLND